MGRLGEAGKARSRSGIVAGSFVAGDPFETDLVRIGAPGRGGEHQGGELFSLVHQAQSRCQGALHCGTMLGSPLEGSTFGVGGRLGWSISGYSGGCDNGMEHGPTSGSSEPRRGRANQTRDSPGSAAAPEADREGTATMAETLEADLELVSSGGAALHERWRKGKRKREGLEGERQKQMAGQGQGGRKREAWGEGRREGQERSVRPDPASFLTPCRERLPAEFRPQGLPPMGGQRAADGTSCHVSILEWLGNCTGFVGLGIGIAWGLINKQLWLEGELIQSFAGLSQGLQQGASSRNRPLLPLQLPIAWQLEGVHWGNFRLLQLGAAPRGKSRWSSRTQLGFLTSFGL